MLFELTQQHLPLDSNVPTCCGIVAALQYPKAVTERQHLLATSMLTGVKAYTMAVTPLQYRSHMLLNLG